MSVSSRHHPPAPSSKEEGEYQRDRKAPSSLEEGVGGGGSTRKVLLERAARMRREPTEPERRMWNELRGKAFAGYKFRRQATIGNRIVDFFCPAKELIVEVDGDTHDREEDLKRDAMVENRTGFRTLRFTNRDVMDNIDGVLMALNTALDLRPDRWAGGLHHPPTPSSEEEGETRCNLIAPSSSEEGVGGGGG